MDTQNNDLIKLFEAFYRFKEVNGTIPRIALINSIHAGLAGLERNQKEIIKQSIDDFQQIAQLIKDIYYQLYEEQPLAETEHQSKAQDILSLDEVIKTYKITRKIKDPRWREQNSDFPFYQPTGNNGKIITYRHEIEEYVKKKNKK